MKRCAASFRGSRARDLTLFFSLPLSALYEIFFTLTKLRKVFFIIIVQQVFFPSCSFSSTGSFSISYKRSLIVFFYLYLSYDRILLFFFHLFVSFS